MYEDVLERLAQHSAEAEQEADEAMMQLSDSALPVDGRIQLRALHLRQSQTASNLRAIVKRAVAAGHGSDVLTRFVRGENYEGRSLHDLGSTKS